MTPTKYAVKDFPLSGGGPEFAEFIRSELIPFVDKNYRTIEGDRMISGHSFGGLFAGYAMLKHPDLFKRYLIVGPSFWFDNSVIFKYELEYVTNHTDLPFRVHISAGERETDRMKSDVLKLAETLRARNYPNLSIESHIFEDESHWSLFPIAFTKGIRYLFADFK